MYLGDVDPIHLNNSKQIPKPNGSQHFEELKARVLSCGHQMLALPPEPRQEFKLV